MKHTDFIFLFGFLMFAIIYGVGIWQHEATHKEIAYSYGCTNSKLGIKGSAIYFQCLNRSSTITPDEEILQNLNEIVGYNIDLISYSVFMGCFLIALCISHKNS